MNKKVSLFLLITWMIVIFTLSAFNASASSSQSGFFVKFFCRLFNIKNVELMSIIIRKLAHLTEYFILGILTINYVRFYNIKYKYIISICFGFFYACTDEFHQAFVPGRSGQVTDVLIDTVGVIFGCLFFYIICKLIRIKKQKK